MCARAHMYFIRQESVCSIDMLEIILKMELNQEPEASNQQLSTVTVWDLFLQKLQSFAEGRNL